MAKLNREAKLRDRRVEKAARKDARKRAAAMPGEPGDAGDEFTDDYADDAEESPVEGLVR